MQKKTIFRMSLIAVIVFACTLILRSNTTSLTSTCKESMEDCRKKPETTNPNTNMIWESLSRQFFSATDVSY